MVVNVVGLGLFLTNNGQLWLVVIKGGQWGLEWLVVINGGQMGLEWIVVSG